MPQLFILKGIFFYDPIKTIGWWDKQVVPWSRKNWRTQYLEEDESVDVYSRALHLGAAGLVWILADQPTNNNTNYALHDGVMKSLPALYVGKRDGELLRELASEISATATLIQTGSIEPGVMHEVYGMLPGISDEAILITDKRCAASDTLATSYILSCALQKLNYDIVLCGRQAIDGDTAQVGPQLAEKLRLTQITYAEELNELTDGAITIRRNIGNGWQQVRAKLPVLITVTASANEPRVPAAKKMMKFKKARTPMEIEQQLKQENPEADEVTLKQLAEHKYSQLEQQGLLIKQWDLDFLDADLTWCGRNGSPTKVHRIQSVVLAAKETRTVTPDQKAIANMIHELIRDKTIA